MNGAIIKHMQTDMTRDLECINQYTRRPFTEQEVYTNLKAMTSDSIVILLSHRLYLFPEMDQVIWMEHGHAAVGTHEEIMEKYPEYARLYEEQTKGSTAEKVNAGKCAETEQGRKERGRAE